MTFYEKIQGAIALEQKHVNIIVHLSGTVCHMASFSQNFSSFSIPLDWLIKCEDFEYFSCSVLSQSHSGGF